MDSDNLPIKGFSPVANDHAANPRNQGKLSSYNGHAKFVGPCGDTMEFWVLVSDDIVKKANCATSGCGSSRAASSMATCLVVGKPLDDAIMLEKDDILAALGGLPIAMEHCAMLAAETVKAACVDYLRRSQQYEPGETHPHQNVLDLYHHDDCGDSDASTT